MDHSYSLSKSNVCLLLCTENVSITPLTKMASTSSSPIPREEKKQKEKSQYALLTFTDFILFGKMKKGKIEIEKFIELSTCSIDETVIQNECDFILRSSNGNYQFHFNSFSDKSLWLTKFTEIPHKQLNGMIPLTIQEIYPIPVRSSSALNKSQSFSRMISRKSSAGIEISDDETMKMYRKSKTPLINLNSYNNIDDLDDSDEFDDFNDKNNEN